MSRVGVVGYATNGHTAIAAHYRRRRHDRVVLFTDETFSLMQTLEAGRDADWPF